MRARKPKPEEPVILTLSSDEEESGNGSETSASKIKVWISHIISFKFMTIWNWYLNIIILPSSCQPPTVWKEPPPMAFEPVILDDIVPDGKSMFKFVCKLFVFFLEF